MKNVPQMLLRLFLFTLFFLNSVNIYAGNTCPTNDTLITSVGRTTANYTSYHNDKIIDSNDADYYKVIIESRTELKINVRARNPKKKTKFIILEGDCSTIISNTTKNSKNYTVTKTLNPGTYYAKVFYSQDNNTKYKIRAKFSDVSDLSITKSVDKSTVSIGETVTFTLTATNLGPDQSDIVMTDTIPAGFTNISATDNITNGFECVVTDNDVSCTGGNALNVTETFIVTITATATTAGTYTNTASVVSHPDEARSDPNMDDNSDDVDVTIEASKPLTISISPIESNISVGTASVSLSVDLNETSNLGDITIDYSGTCGTTGTLVIQQGSLSGIISVDTSALTAGSSCTVTLDNASGNNGALTIIQDTATINVIATSNISISPIESNISVGTASVSLNVDLNEVGNFGDITITYSGTCPLASNSLVILQGSQSGTIIVDTSALAEGSSCTVTLDNANGTNSGALTINPDTATINVGIAAVTDPEFTECGLFPSALNTWDTINRGNSDVVINADTIFADGGVSGSGNQDIQCESGGNTADCIIDQMAESIPTLPVFITSPTSDSYTATNTESNPSYGDVTISNNASVTFTPAGTYSNGNAVMLIRSLDIESGATVTFGAGDYWIENWTSAASVTIRTNGKVRLFIGGDMILTANHTDFNYDGGNGTPSDMFLFIYGDFTFASQGGGSQQDIAAYVYVQGSYTGNHNSANSHFKGAVTSVGSINLNNNHEYEYDDSGLVNGWGDCGPVTVQFVLEDYNVSEDIDSVGTLKAVLPEITLSRVLSYDVNVSYRTHDGTATVAAGDYIQIIHDSVIIPAGTLSVTVPVLIWNDAPIELTEYFTLELFDPFPTDVILGNTDTTQINILAQEDSPLCFEDHFDNGLDEDWRVLRADGGFEPQIVNVNGSNRLRISDRSHNTSTAVTKDYEFATTENLIIVEFAYYAYGGCADNSNYTQTIGNNHLGDWGADGIASILFDSTVGTEPEAGGTGGSLGYAQKSNHDGFEGGWLGLGLDEFGNFAKANEGKSGGISDKYVNAVTIRGSGIGRTGYAYLDGTRALTPPLAGNLADPLPPGGYFSGIYKMTIDARNPDHLYIYLARDIGDGTGYKTIINKFDAKDAQHNQGSTPAKVRYAISSGTGGACNNHELDWIRLRGNCAPYGLKTTGLYDAWDTFRHADNTIPADINISTKLAGKPFDLMLISYDENSTGYDNKNVMVEAAIYKQNTKTDPVSNIVTLNTAYDPHQLATFTVDKAVKKAVVGFKICSRITDDDDYYLLPLEVCQGLTTVYDCFSTTVRESPVWRMCASTDDFSIRPNRFNIANIPSGNMRAGIGYDINYTALTVQNIPAEGYSQGEGGSFELKGSLNPAIAGCINNDLNVTPNLMINDGTYSSGATSFNTIGDFNLSIYENEGDEFAKVDADDTPYDVGDKIHADQEIRPINPFTVDNISIIPFGYTITSLLSNAHDAAGAAQFTYINDISTGSTMAGKLNINITATTDGSSPAENYETDCYAKAINLNVDYNLSAIDNNTLSQLQYYVPDPLTSGSVALVAPTETPNNGTLNMPFASTIFKNGQLGRASIALSLNFDRTFNLKVSPFDLAIGDINVTETGGAVSGQETNTDTNLIYYYAKIRASKEEFEDIKTNTVETPILINIYCAYATAACNAFNINAPMTDHANWYPATSHDQATNDGNIALRVRSPLAEGIGYPTIDTNMNPIPSDIIILSADNGEKNATISAGGGPSLPMTVDIDIVVNGDPHTPPFTDSWLIYNKDANIVPRPLYRVRFIGAVADWSGVGDTGHAIDVNISDTNTKRMDW